jgi:hypothetical protein
LLFKDVNKTKFVSKYLTSFNPLKCTLFGRDSKDLTSAELTIENLLKFTSNNNWVSTPFGIHGVAVDVIQARQEILGKAVELLAKQNEEILEL